MNRLSIILCMISVILICYVIFSYKKQSCKRCLENMIASESDPYGKPRNTVVG